MRYSVLLVASLLLASPNASALAQRPRDTRRLLLDDTLGFGDRIQVAVRGATIEVLLDRRGARADIIENGRVAESPTRTMRGFFSADSIQALLGRLATERAMTDSFRFASALPPPGAYVYLKRPTFSLEFHRRPESVGSGGRYGIQASGCRERRIGVDVSEKELLRIEQALERGAHLAAKSRAVAPDGAPLGEEKLSCPVRALLGNRFPRLTSFSSVSARVRFVVDASGFVEAQSLRREQGDRELSDRAIAAIKLWRFLPALDADRRPVRQLVRLLVIEGPPTLALDTAALAAQAKAANAQFALVARALSPVHERLLADSGQTIRVVSFGESPRMLFLHGPGDGADEWEAVADYLTPAIPSAAYDLRGHGGSRRDDGSEFDDFSIESQVADLDRVVQSLGDVRPILVTHDASAAIAAEFARRHPERIAGLVLISPIRDGSKDPLLARVRTMRPFVLPMSAGDMLRPGFTFRAKWEDLQPNAMIEDRALVSLAPTSRVAAVQTTMSALNFDLRAALAAYHGPIYVVESGSMRELAGSFAIDNYDAARRGDSTSRRLIVSHIEGGTWPMLSTPTFLAARLRAIVDSLR